MTAMATIAIEKRKCTETTAGLSLVSTLMPPSTACMTTPAARAVAEPHQVGAARGSAITAQRAGSRQAATSTATVTAVTTNVSSRLPNSIHVFSIVCPGVWVATRLLAVHCGQSGQPSPDLLSLTAAPVTMIPAFTTTAASASPRMERRLGRQTSTAGSARRANTAAAQPRRPRAVRAGALAGADSAVTGRPDSPEAPASPGALTLVATCSS